MHTTDQTNIRWSVSAISGQATVKVVLSNFNFISLSLSLFDLIYFTSASYSSGYLLIYQ